MSRLSREILEPVLLKAAVLMCQDTNNSEVRVISDLCQVSHLWWLVLHSCHRQKRAEFQHLLDSEFISRLWFNHYASFLTFREAAHLASLEKPGNFTLVREESGEIRKSKENCGLPVVCYRSCGCHRIDMS